MTPRKQRQRTDGLTGDYPENFDEIADFIKDAADRQCVRCHHEHDVETHFVLTVHHLDMDKPNVQPWNLVALCQRCHLRVQGKVDFNQQYMFGHSAWLTPFLREWNESLGPGPYYEPLGRGWRRAVLSIYQELGHDPCPCGDWQLHNRDREAVA